MEEDRACINIPRLGRGSVNHHRADDTLPGLGGVMRVIPRRTIVCGSPPVSEGITWCDWTLCDSRHAVVLGVVQLTNAVEMYASAVVLQLVVDSDDDVVTPVSFNDGPWKLAVNSQRIALDTIRGDCSVGNVEVVVHGSASLWGEVVVIGSDIRTTIRQRTTLAFTGYTVLVNSFTLEHGRSFRSALGKCMCACSC